jgi:hypothetical protein
MPITKTVLKKVRQQAVVSLVGSGVMEIDLNADLKLSDEVFRGYANTNVMINSAIFSTGNTIAPAMVSRGGSNVLLLFGNDNWSFSQLNGFTLTQNNTANISVTIPDPGGTVILGLTKTTGYTEPDQQSIPR